jgi:endonuclease/exonuclease/phosphatase family metal-dependent hydrolase
VQAGRLVSLLKKENTAPLIFAGDLNSKLGSAVLSSLEEHLTNVLLGTGYKSFAKHPFRYEDFEVNKLEYLLDYIFVNDSVRVRSVEVKDVACSDHLPVVACLEV